MCPKAELALAHSPQSPCVALATSGLHQIQPVVLKWLAKVGRNGEAKRGPSSFVLLAPKYQYIMSSSNGRYIPVSW